MISALENREEQFTLSSARDDSPEPGELFNLAKTLDKHDHLNGLSLQVKKRYFPQIAMKTDRCRNNIMVPNSNILNNGTGTYKLGAEKRSKDVLKSYFQSEVPHGGAWFQRTQVGFNLDP